jgi:hypothetical protein
VAVHHLFIDTDRGLPVMSATNSGIADLPLFVQQDTLNLRITLLTGFSRIADYTVIPVADLTLHVALGRKIGNATTYYTQQFTWTPSEDLADPFWEAALPMNTAAIDTLLGSSASKSTAYFEVRLIDGGLPRTVLSRAVTIHAAVIKDGGMSEPAEPTPLSVEAANVLFLKRDITGHIILRNEDDPTIAVDIYVDSDGTFHTDPLE